MVQGQNKPFVQNNFIGGLKTEFTALNFPENACTAVSNFLFTITGDCTRRGGFNWEANYSTINPNLNNSGMTTYKWNNAGGDGSTEFVVQQVGDSLYFFQSSITNINSKGLSATNKFTIVLPSFLAIGSTVFNRTAECQFADGNGILFVFHPSCDPFYVTFTNGILNGNRIDVQIRDFAGIQELGVSNTLRPTTLSSQHNYNLLNQGWTQGAWTATSTTQIDPALGQSIIITMNAQSASAAPNIPVAGSIIQIGTNSITDGTTFPIGTQVVGTCTAFSFPTITITVTSITNALPATSQGTIYLSLVSEGNINKFQTGLGAYPSNSDVWWEFRDSTGAFNPTGTAGNITLDDAPAPKGHFILDAFNMDRSNASGQGGLTIQKTAARPTTGCFFQDRVWYAGVNGVQDPSGTASYYTWTENIYFSQAINQQVQGQGTEQYGQCYQTDDPTSDKLFNLLPTDGGLIVIEGAGNIYKLFPITNGLLVFAANGVWFITGSGGLGFAANDYTIAKISGVRCISGSSFVDVLGYPVFWNAEGIWSVTPNQQAVPYGHGGLTAENLCLGTILSYYQSIPLASKLYAKGAFDPVNYTIQWTFRSTNESTIISRYQYDSLLALNTVNRAFYTYSFPSTTNFINGVFYLASPGGNTLATPPVFKYPTTFNINKIGGGILSSLTFSEEKDFTNYVDFITFDSIGTNFTSTFTAGYNLHGGLIARWNPEYVYLFLRGNANGYLINGIWDYATDPSSGRIPAAEYVQVVSPLYGFQIKRHRIRGRGYAFQLQIQSIPGQPLDLMGWSIYEHQAVGP